MFSSEMQWCDHKRLPFVEFDGHKRYLGSLTPKKSYAHFGAWSDSSPVIPESEWVEFEDPDDHLIILDQNGHGSCVGHGSCSAFQHAWSVARNAPERFSPNYLYSLINRGSDNGAVVGDAMDALMQHGICLESTVPEGDIIFTRQMPATAAPEANRFKLDTAYRVSTWLEIGTVVQLRRAVSIGVEIGRNFNPNSQGVLPDLSGRGGGHCMCLRLGMKKINGVWYIKGQNSWGQSWGQGGHFWMNESYFQGQTDHFVPVCPKLDPNEPTIPVLT